MKWPSDQVEILRQGFREFLEKVGYGGPTAEPLAAARWIFPRVAFDLQYDDSHPAFSPGVWDDGQTRPARMRLVSHNPNFVLYPDGCNDNHLDTVLKLLAKEFDL